MSHCPKFAIAYNTIYTILWLIILYFFRICLLSNPPLCPIRVAILAHYMIEPKFTKTCAVHFVIERKALEGHFFGVGCSFGFGGLLYCLCGSFFSVPVLRFQRTQSSFWFLGLTSRIIVFCYLLRKIFF